MKETRCLHLVGINCPPELEEKFNKWYNEVHIPMMMQYKGIKNATRTKIARPVGDLPQYLAIYEFDSLAAYDRWMESPEHASLMAETDETWKAKKYNRVWRVQYEIIKTWTR